MAEIKDQESLEAWLKTQPREVSMAIAARAALRVLPLLDDAFDKPAYISERVIPALPRLFFATFVPWLLAAIPNHGLSESSAVFAGDRAHSASDLGGPGPAASAAHSAVLATVTAINPDYVRAASLCVDAAATSVQLDLSAYWAKVSDVSSIATKRSAALWKTVEHDASLVAKQKLMGLREAPLWPNGKMPDWIVEISIQFKDRLLSTPLHFDVWTEWYESRLHGGPVDFDEQRIRASMEPEIWLKKTAAEYNVELKRRLSEAGSWPAFGSIASIEDVSDTASASGPVTDLALPSAPPPKPAAIEPIWRDKKLGRRKSSASSPLKGKALNAALKALQLDLRDLAVNARSEANIDERIVRYVETLAQRIPTKSPPQFELFRLAHASKTLASYGQTVTEQWPDILAAQYLAVARAYDSTIRQFPRWKEFVANSLDELDLPPNEATTAFGNDTTTMLQADESRSFIASDLPRALNDLITELSNVDRTVIQTGKELLVADILQSISNIASPIAEVALKGVKKYGKALDEGFQKAAKKQGRKDGAALFKWARRTILAMALATTTYFGAGVLPSAISWLKPIEAFFKAQGK